MDFKKTLKRGKKTIIISKPKFDKNNKLDFHFATSDIDFSNPSTNGLKYDDIEVFSMESQHETNYY